MNSIRKSLCVLVALGMAAFAMPGMAAPSPAKLYSLSVCVGSFDESGNCVVAQSQVIEMSTQPTTLEVRVFNVSPPNTNSNFNSVDLFFNVNWGGVAGSAFVDDNAGNLRIDLSTRHVKISNLAPVKPGEHVTVTFEVDNHSCGDAIVDALVYTGSNFSGSRFAPGPGYIPPTALVACGRFACGNSIGAVQPQGAAGLTDPKYIQELKRGLYNENGTTGGTCSQLFAYVTPTVTPSDVTVHASWDQNQPDSDFAFFRYIVNLTSTSTVNPPTLLVAWQLLNNGSPDFQPALFCDPSRPDLPAPLATLVADNGSKIQVTPIDVPELPFPILIDQERMLVTKVITSTNTWFVTRHMGGTLQVTHFSPAKVMSTPFKIVQSTDGYSSSYVGKPAKMCINNLVHSIVNPTQWSATVVDGSDGWVKGR